MLLPMGPTHMSFLLVEEFSAMCLMSAIEGLRAANYVMGRNAYSWSSSAMTGSR